MPELAVPRVVVLGRTGDAQQQLQQALAAIGVQTLAAGDFDELDPDRVRGQNPDAILVSIDETTNDTDIGRWQSLFDDPGMTVVFDDADVSSRLSGWDLARWARHLAAKVLGKPDDVLPPVQADAERLPQIMALDATMPDFERGDGVFKQDMRADQETDAAADTHDFVEAPKQVGAESEPAEPETPAPDLSEPETADFDALSSQFEAQQQRAASEEQHSEAAPTLDELLARETSTQSIVGNPLAIPSDEVQGEKARPQSATLSPTSALELTPFDTTYTPVKTAKPADAADDIDLSAYALEPLHDEPADVAPPPSPALAKKKPKTKSVVPVIPTAAGVVAIVAGLGGPDAVRQVLAALPKTLPVPVLLWQHLDAGKHDRLAQQLAKASALPVYLARDGEIARNGAVAVMTPSAGVKHDSEGWRFNVAEGGVAAALDSALGEPSSLAMVLSGADGSVVDIAAAHATRGSEVRVQTPDSCFDGAAASALSARGVSAASPIQLAAVAASHWPA